MGGGEGHDGSAEGVPGVNRGGASQARQQLPTSHVITSFCIVTVASLVQCTAPPSVSLFLAPYKNAQWSYSNGRCGQEKNSWTRIIKYVYWKMCQDFDFTTEHTPYIVAPLRFGGFVI
jgi:hypothetical protein